MKNYGMCRVFFTSSREASQCIFYSTVCYPWLHSYHCYQWWMTSISRNMNTGTHFKRLSKCLVRQLSSFSPDVPNIGTKRLYRFGQKFQHHLRWAPCTRGFLFDNVPSISWYSSNLWISFRLQPNKEHEHHRNSYYSGERYNLTSMFEALANRAMSAIVKWFPAV